MPQSLKDIESILLNKLAFTRATGHGNDHKWFELTLPGITRIITKLSHGRGTVTRKIEGKIAKQVGVTGPFFAKMLDCTNSRKDYYDQVQLAPVGHVRQLPSSHQADSS